MPHSQPLLFSPSSEFIALCQSQIELLAQGLKADWSAVYLTQGWGEGQVTKLLPVVVYLQTEPLLQQDTPITTLPEMGTENESIMLPAMELTQDKTDSVEFFSSELGEAFSQQHNQVILPLIYEEIVMGLLVTRREQPDWEGAELAQIEKIAKTLAIARFLDQRQVWYQQQLQEQYAKQAVERDRLDNLLHQLRNPLTALRTFGKLLLKRLLPDERQQKAVQGIIRESDRIQDLLHQFEQEIELLTMDSLSPTPIALPQATPIGASLLLPSASLALESLTIESVLEPLLISAQAIAQEKHLELSCYIPRTLPMIQGNSKALREVLSNLIDNGIKYTPSGGKIEVSIILRNGQEGVQISDTGYGIPWEDQKHIFERRYRGVQEQGEIPGTGLGLAIVKELVEQMDGKIELISPNNKSQDKSCPGTTFIVWFPVV